MFDRVYIVMVDGKPVSAFCNITDAFSLAESIRREGEKPSELVTSCPVFMSWYTIGEMAGEADE